MKFIRIKAIFFMLVMLSVSLLAVDDGIPNNSRVRQVHQDIDSLLDPRSGRAIAARDRLKALPAELVVPILCDTLRKNPDVGRYHAYEVLSHHHAADYQVGLDLLIEGLSDDLFSQMVFLPLSQAPPDKVDQAVAAITDWIVTVLDSAEVIVPTKMRAFRALGLIGSEASSSTELLLNILNDAGQNPKIRKYSSDALIRIRGIAGFMNDLGPPIELDEFRAKMLVKSVRGFSYNKRYQFLSDTVESRALIQFWNWRLSTVDSDDRSSAFRQAANTMMVIGDYNPEGKGEIYDWWLTTLDRFSKDESDSTIRQAATDSLLSFRTRFEKEGTSDN